MSTSSFAETSPTYSQSKKSHIKKILSQTEFNDDSSTEIALFDSKIISQQNSPSSISKIRRGTKSFFCSSFSLVDENQECIGSLCEEHQK